MPKDLKGRELPKGIYQRKDGRYEARAVINGVNIQIYDLNLKNLKIKFEQQKLAVQTGLDQKRASITLDDWFEEWFEQYKLPNIKETSINPMRSKYYNNFSQLLGNKKVSDIRNIDIQNVINIMKQDGKAASSIRDALGRLRDCLESAKRNHIISENPCFDIYVPNGTISKERRFLSAEEQNKFLKQAEESWYKEMFFIMFLTGMRVGEIGGLRWEDVDFKNKCINVKHSLSCEYYKGKKTMRLTAPKTYNSYRCIPFIGEAEEMLLSQKKKQEQLKKELGDRYRSQDEFADVVFVTSMGSPLTRHNAEKEVKRIVSAINEKEAFDSVREGRVPVIFEDLYPHAIRHTFCSRCFQNDINPKIVQKLMGHQHYSTTIDIYTHVMQEDVNKEASKIESAIIDIAESDFTKLM